MSLLAKRASSRLDHSFDWSGLIAADEHIQLATWTVAPVEAGGLEIDSQDGSGPIQGVVISGGRLGEMYRLICQISTSKGRQLTRGHSIKIMQD